MKLPKIYEHFSQGQIFTIADAKDKLNSSGNTLRKRLCELASRGYISSIRQGMYRVASWNETAEKMHSSPFAIATKIAPHCYIGFKSALQMHANELPPENDTVYVISTTKFNSFKFEKRTFFWCQPSEDKGVQSYRRTDNGVSFEIRSTDIEKSIIDCLKRPMHSPPFPELLKLCQRLPTPPNFDKLIAYASYYKAQSLFNRLGYLMENMQENWPTEEAVFREIEKRMSRKQINWSIPLTREKIAPSFLEKSRWKVNFPTTSPGINSFSIH